MTGTVWIDLTADEDAPRYCPSTPEYCPSSPGSPQKRKREDTEDAPQYSPESPTKRPRTASQCGDVEIICAECKIITPEDDLVECVTCTRSCCDKCMASEACYRCVYSDSEDEEEEEEEDEEDLQCIECFDQLNSDTVLVCHKCKRDFCKECVGDGKECPLVTCLSCINNGELDGE